MKQNNVQAMHNDVVLYLARISAVGFVNSGTLRDEVGDDVRIIEEPESRVLLATVEKDPRVPFRAKRACGIQKG